MCTTSLSIRDFPLNIQRWFVGFETLGWEEDENKQIGGFEYESITAEEIHDSRDGFAKSKRLKKRNPAKNNNSLKFLALKN